MGWRVLSKSVWNWHRRCFKSCGSSSPFSRVWYRSSSHFFTTCRHSNKSENTTLLDIYFQDNVFNKVNWKLTALTWIFSDFVIQLVSRNMAEVAETQTIAKPPEKEGIEDQTIAKPPEKEVTEDQTIAKPPEKEGTEDQTIAKPPEREVTEDQTIAKLPEKNENGARNEVTEAVSGVQNLSLGENGVKLEEKKLNVIFVLGGPGSGKGTQCANIVETFGFTHLSAGDLLRAEIKSGSENGTMIENMIREGKIVPSEVTVKLLQKAMKESGNDKFLIDGFPRNEENRAAFEEVTGIQPYFVLFFDCPEEEMEKRLLSRNQGRVDDNIETIRKRFKVFIESSLPVIDYYDTKGKVRKVDASKTKEEVFEIVKFHFAPFIKDQEGAKVQD